MIMPELGSKAEAIGIMSAIAVIGPKPGNMPINVPAKHPVIKNKMFCKENAVLNPAVMPSNIDEFRPRGEINAKEFRHD